MRQAAEQAGARTRLTEITEVRLRERQVRIPREQLQGRCLILATGAAPRRLDLPGETEWTGRGIHYCATCDGMFYRNKTVLVVGGGNTAVTEALELARLCRRVLLVHRRDRLRAEPGSEERLQRAGVELCWNSTVAALHGDSRLTGVTLQENGRTRRLDCDGVFVAIGRVASTELFQDQLSLAADGSIPAGESTVTEIPGVFAAGDLRQKPLRQIVTATADGATAAYQAIRWCIGQ